MMAYDTASNPFAEHNEALYGNVRYRKKGNKFHLRVEPFVWLSDLTGHTAHFSDTRFITFERAK